MAVGGPAAEDDAVSSERANGEDEKKADVQIGDLKCRTNRQRGIGEKRHRDADDGRHPEHELIGVGGDDVFFEKKFYSIGDGLKQTMRADAHGAEAGLHVGHDFAFEQNDVACEKGQHGDDHDGIDHRQNVRRYGGWNEVTHQRSTSPRTMSMVPMMATTSATSAPCAIF